MSIRGAVASLIATGDMAPAGDTEGAIGAPLVGAIGTAGKLKWRPHLQHAGVSAQTDLPDPTETWRQQTCIDRWSVLLMTATIPRPAKR